MKKRIAFFRAVIVVSALVLNSLQIVHAAPLLQGAADLTLLDIVSDPPNPAPWDSLHYISHVENQGTERAEVRVWYYVDGVRVTGENEYWGSLDPGYTREVDFQHSGLSEGWHTIKFVVDPEDAVAESNETNNEIEDTFCIGTCEPQYPDVVVEQIDWTPGSPLVGDTMHFTVHVQNEGTANTSPWGQVGVRLFIDGTSIGDDYVSNIAPGTTEFFDFYWTATSGCHTVRAVADCGDYIPESDEGNNERVESCCVSSPDLVVEQIDWTPSSPLVGDSMHFTVHIQNEGTANTSPWGQVGTRLFIDGTSIGDDYASNIAPGTTEFFDFYWTATAGHHTVRAVADYGDFIPESDESNNEREESFDVTCPTPSAPSLSSPSNGSSTCDTTPYFDWSSVSGATSYRIQVDDSSSFTSPAIDTTTSSSSYTPGTALSLGTYYWRVRASNSCGDGSWSPVWSVTVLSTPGTPSLVSPSNGATTDDSTPTLDWGSVSGATSYRVQVDNNSSFSSPEIDQTTSSSSYTPSGALADGAYHWRVEASNSCGSGSWSAVRSFTIETSCPAPPAPSLSSPSDSSSTCDTTPYFDWSSVSGATSYRIQVDDSSSFTSPAVDTTTSSSSYTPGTALAPDTYYWRVRASNFCGDSSWSSVWSVTILSTPGIPSLVSPSNGATTDDNTPALDWGSVSGATSYRVQVDDNSSFSSPEIDQTTSNTSYIPNRALADGTYHWRVQASNSCGSGSWSAAWSFTIETYCPTPSAPSLSSPSNGSSTCDTTPYFDWSSVSGATSYRIQVDDSSSFSSPAIDTTTSNSNYTPGTALASDTYYWRVRASNSCGDGSWSSVWSVTILSIPGVPSLVSPSNGTSTDDSTPTLDWGSVSGAASYRVQVDNNSSFSSPEIDQTTSSSSCTPSSALADGTYHWRVQASNSCGSGSWSAVWSFTIETSCPTPSAPSLYSPSNGSSTCDTTPYFDWSSVSGATSYHIQVDDSSSFSSPGVDTTTSNSYYTPGSALAPGMYYWRVRASNPCGDGSWSSVWSFTILSTPGTPSLSSPANGSTTDDSTPNFDWGSVSGATSYRIQVDNDPGFGSPEIDETTTSSSYTPSSALADGTYHWRVRASNTCGTGSWSTTWRFTISVPSPDFVVTRIVGLPDGDGAWDSWQFDAYVKNVGDLAYGEGATYRGFVDGTLCEEWRLPSLAPSEEKRVDFGWGGGALGDHTVCVVADPSNIVDETNEYNNEMCQNFTVGEPHPGRPQAILQVSPRNVVVGTESVRLDGSNSYDPDGQVARYRFDFGDGTPPEWSDHSMRYHTYDQVGEYQVSLKVQDDSGLAGNWSPYQTIAVEETPPTDDRPPDIRYVSFSPGSIHVLGCSGTTTATVLCQVDDDSDISYVTLRYALDSEPYAGILMTRVADNVYQTSIGGFDQGGALNYFVEASDVHDNYGRTDTYSAFVAECPSGPADLSLVDVSWTPSQLMALEDSAIILTLRNEGSGDFDPSDGSYIVELEIYDGFLSLPVPLVLSFSTENHGGRMNPVLLPIIPAGESYIVVLSGIRFPNTVDNGTLVVTFQPIEGEINLDNNTAEVPISVAEPANPADCTMLVARLCMLPLLPPETSPITFDLLDLLETLWRCQGDSDCAKAVSTQFFTEWFLEESLSLSKILDFFDTLLTYAEEFEGCSKWLSDVISSVLVNLDLMGAVTGNSVSVHSPAYVLVRNNDGQLAGFADTGEKLEQILGSQVVAVGDSKYVMVPGDDLEIVRFRGTNYGTALIEMSLARPDGSVVLLSYRDLPLTPDTVCILDTRRESWILDVDADGDGIVDEVRLPDEIETRWPHRIYLPCMIKEWSP